MKLDSMQELNVLYKLCMFRTDQKTKMATLVSDLLRHFYFSYDTVERILTKLDRKQERNVLYQVCIFRVDQKTKMSAQPLI